MLPEIEHARIADRAGTGTNRRSVPVSLISTGFPARSERVAIVPLATRDRKWKLDFRALLLLARVAAGK
jgi:hypothetical protein